MKLSKNTFKTGKKYRNFYVKEENKFCHEPPSRTNHLETLVG